MAKSKNLKIKVMYFDILAICMAIYSKTKVFVDVKLVSVPKESALGQVSGSDSIIEIYTESYGENPLVIQGAGAGAAVTARGVFGDILRIAEKI